MTFIYIWLSLGIIANGLVCIFLDGIKNIKDVKFYPTTIGFGFISLILTLLILLIYNNERFSDRIK